jgi:phosphotransferase system enzyme I (PtsI)
MELTASPPPIRQLQGVGVSPGIARGRIVRMGDPLPAPSSERSALASSEELTVARAAMASVADDLRGRANLVAEPGRGVLQAQALMAVDPALSDDVARAVSAGVTAARAVWDAFATFRESLLRSHLADRVADLDDVRDRIVAACLGVAPPQVPDPGHPFVLAARTLSPADTAGLRAEQVRAIVTVEGSATSHTAILARTLGIPAVVDCVEVLDLDDGTPVMVHGALGIVEVDVEPSDDAPLATVTPLARATGSRAHTSDGVGVAVMANIGQPLEVAAAAAAGAEGVGLLRTEFLYLRADSPPSVADQTAALVQVMSAFPDELVVVRLLDAGGDKPLPFLTSGHEPNPALGVRGLRALRQHQDILTQQLDAVVAAAGRASARVAVMAPMVTDADDAAWFVSQVRARRDWPTEISIGVMIETPAAALTASSVLSVCDFASIGTNDLAQYVMAADRSLGALSGLQSPWHPAVLELVARVAAAGERLGKPVGVCGEAAADPLMALVFAGLGVRNLSMSWSAMDDVRSMLARHSMAACVAAGAAALASRDAATARAAAKSALGRPGC